jgi:hypothetical protein
MALQSNAFAILQQNKQKQNEIWHNDFFATMNNKVWEEPGFFWEPGMANIEYTGLEAGNPTESWSTYSRAAKSRGMQPDYQRFMETYKSIKTTRDTKILDKFNQLSTMYANNDDFKKALRETIRSNPRLRNDLSEGMRLNPEHPGNASIQLAFQEYGQDPKEAATNKAISGAMERFNPAGINASTIRTAGTAGIAAGNWAAGNLTGKQALGRAFIPGAGSADAIRGAFGKGPYSRGQFIPQKTNAAGRTSGGFTRSGKNVRARTALQNRRKFMDEARKGKGKTWRGYDRGRFGSIDKNIKTLNDLKAPDIDDFRTKANQSKIRGWKRDLTKNLNRGIKDLKAIRGDVGKRSLMDKMRGKSGAAQRKLDKQIKDLNKAKRELVNLGKNNKKITKKAFTKVVNKNIQATGAKSLKWAVSKVGWGGILKRAGAKLAAKMVFSGIMKGAAPATYGVTGLVSLGLDAWTAVEVANLIADIAKEYDTQSKAQSQGSAQYKTGIRPTTSFKGYANI